MPTDQPILAPANFAPAQAVGYSTPDGRLQLVSATTPLPMATVLAAASAPLAGAASTSGFAGPWQPGLGRAVTLELTGVWSGSVSVSRSTDGGITRQLLTAGGAPWARFTANACEVVWEENDPAARLYLELTVASGSVTYRLAQ